MQVLLPAVVVNGAAAADGAFVVGARAPGRRGEN
jgi:hypothetical protein